jgi:hypothetical protein
MPFHFQPSRAVYLDRESDAVDQYNGKWKFIAGVILEAQRALVVPGVWFLSSLCGSNEYVFYVCAARVEELQWESLLPAGWGSVW